LGFSKQTNEQAYFFADTLPGIKVNTDAMARTIELVQQGFLMVSES
jgi:hypothetical protein